MDDKNKEEPKKDKTEAPAPKQDEGIQSETESLIEQSNKAAERNEKVLVELKKENDRAEKMAIQNQLAGKGQTVQPTTPTISKEEQASQDRIKAIGDATGANWAKAMEGKQDEPNKTNI